MKYFFATLFIAGLYLGGSDGKYFPVVNFIGVGLLVVGAIRLAKKA